MEQVQKQFLTGGITILTEKNYTFGTDAVLLEYFSSPKTKDIACDIGTGCGIIPLLWCRNKVFPPKISAVEIQPEAALLAQKSVALNGLEDRVNIICGDIRQIAKDIGRESFSLVTCNPPYKTENGGEASASVARKTARHELTCSVFDVAKAASVLLKFSGRLCMCQRPERLTDTIDAMLKYSIEPKKLRFVHQHTEKEPWLFLIEGRKGGKRGIRVEPPLIIEKKPGEYSDEIRKIYQMYEEEQR